MKSLLYKALSLLLVVAVSTSCIDDVLDTQAQSSFEPSTVYSNYELAEYTIFAIAHTFGDTNCYRGRINMWYGTNTDIELHGTTSVTGSPDLNKCTIPEYDVTTSNGQLSASNNAYTSLTAAIERANLAIEGLRGNADLTNPDMAYLLGEALTYRAFIYFELTKFWGDVPFRTKPVGADDIYLPKTDRDVIYVQILKDLEEAMEYLYWPYEARQTMSMDRMNKAFAKGLYARIALTASGYAWRAADGMVGTGDAGSLRLSVNEELSKAVLYPKALKHLEDIFESGTVALEGDYETLWRKFNNSEHLTNCKEILWVVPMSDSRNRWNYHYAVPHSADSEYTNGTKRGGDIGPMPTLWWKYSKNDVRRDLSCVPYWYNVEKTAGGTGWELRGGVNYWYFGKYRFEWMINAPYQGGNDDGIKHISMRLSDVYLMAAELAAYAGELDKAKQYLLEVRERAYKGNESEAAAYVNGLTIGSAVGNDDAAIADYKTEGSIMKAIIDERALELVGEQIRKQDLIRWGLLKIKLDEASKDLEDLAKMQGAYAAYAPYSEPYEVKNDKKEVIGSCQVYPLYWRQNANGIEIFGLEADEIGMTPADYTETEPNGWIVKENYISSQVFWNSKGTWDNAADYRWSALYKNDFNDPYPRSVWPFFDVVLTSMQGAIVNDFGY